MADIEKINDLVANKEFQEAKILIDEALKESEQDKEILKLAGLIYVNLQLWRNAQKFFESVIKFEQNDATSWFYLANCYEKLGDNISSKNAYITVIDLRPEYLEAYQALCVIALKMNDIETAITYAQKGLELNPDSFIYDFIIGTAYMKNKDFELAEQPLKKSLEKMPNNTGTLNSLGTCYMAQNKTEEAIETYQKAIELNPEFDIAQNNIGVVYLDGFDDAKRALGYFESACALNPNYTLAYFNAGRASQAIGKKSTAAEYYQRAMDLNKLTNDLDEKDIRARLYELFD